jgi:hypothetical protein
MDVTTALTGMLPFIVVVSAVLTAIVSVLLLWLYKRAVVRSMSASSGTPPPVSRANLPGVPGKGSGLTMTTVGAGDPVSGKGHAAYKATSASLRRIGVVYTLAGLAYAFVLSLPWMVTAGGGYPLTRLLWLVVCYAWPTVVTLLLVVTTTRRQGYIVAGVYFGLVVAVSSVALVRNPGAGAGDLIYLWIFANGAATVLLAAFLTRRIRAVGPLVLAFMIAGVTGALLLVTIAGSSDTLLRAIVEVGGTFGLGAVALFILLHLLGFALFGLLGWWLLRWLGRAYRAKRMSDQALTVDALWLMFGVLQSFTLAFEGWGWIFTGLVAFGVYKTVTWLGFARIRGSGGAEQGMHPTLLLLRVFALGKRSERLFDSVSKRWLRAGSIGMIAGPDLVTSTVEPHEFLDFVGGRLSRRFIESEADMSQCLQRRDVYPDPDGRYRVNEFFCRQDTWQMTMRRLAADSDVVLMDLRSFSPGNQGCLWELQQLLNGTPLERVLLVVDETTDQAFLEEQLHALWSQVPADSPNRGHQAPVARLFVAPSSMSRAADALVKQLFDVCIPVTA